LNRPEVIEAEVRMVSAGRGDETIAELASGGGPLGSGGFRFPAALLSLAAEVNAPRHDVGRIRRPGSFGRGPSFSRSMNRG